MRPDGRGSPSRPSPGAHGAWRASQGPRRGSLAGPDQRQDGALMAPGRSGQASMTLCKSGGKCAVWCAVVLPLSHFSRELCERFESLQAYLSTSVYSDEFAEES